MASTQASETQDKTQGKNSNRGSHWGHSGVHQFDKDIFCERGCFQSPPCTAQILRTHQRLPWCHIYPIEPVRLRLSLAPRVPDVPPWASPNPRLGPQCHGTETLPLGTQVSGLLGVPRQAIKKKKLMALAEFSINSVDHRTSPFYPGHRNARPSQNLHIPR